MQTKPRFKHNLVITANKIKNRIKSNPEHRYPHK